MGNCKNIKYKQRRAAANERTRREYAPFVDKVHVKFYAEVGLTRKRCVLHPHA